MIEEEYVTVFMDAGWSFLSLYKNGITFRYGDIISMQQMPTLYCLFSVSPRYSRMAKELIALILWGFPMKNLQNIPCISHTHVLTPSIFSDFQVTKKKLKPFIHPITTLNRGKNRFTKSSDDNSHMSILVIFHVKSKRDYLHRDNISHCEHSMKIRKKACTPQSKFWQKFIQYYKLKLR